MRFLSLSWNQIIKADKNSDKFEAGYSRKSD